jgi:hypothetical protein
MKKKEVDGVINRIIDEMGEKGSHFVVQSEIAFLSPISECYRGFCINPSQLDKSSFDVEIFLLPVYVPTKMFHFTIGWSLHSGIQSWNATRTQEIARRLARDAMPLLERATHGRKLLNALLSLKKDGVIKVLEAIVVAAARTGDKKVLQSAQKKLKEKADVINFPYWGEVVQRTEWIKDNFETNRDGVNNKLTEWKDYTLHNLEIDAKYL